MTDLARPGRRTTTPAVLAGLTVTVFAAAGGALLGWSSSLVVGGSMAPAVRPGDVVITSPMPADRIRAGQVVRFPDPVRPGRQVLHRIARVDERGLLRTKGDANRVEDVTAVPRSSVTGVGRLRVPYVGLPALWWLEGHYARVAGTFVAALALCVLVFRTARR